MPSQQSAPSNSSARRASAVPAGTTPQLPAMAGGFTMPSEAGCEDRVLELARLWGADALRDCEGTALSDKIKDAGYPMYSIICLIRGDNAFAKAHPDMLIQVFLSSREVLADGPRVAIDLLDGWPRDVYRLNELPESVALWQALDRTTGEELPRQAWAFDPATGVVTIAGARMWHRYTVNFLAYEIWESINRYNHRVNNWTSEPLMPLNPAYPEVRKRMMANLETWLNQNPHVDIVRFTTFYYGNGRGGWGDYGRTVSLPLLAEFKQRRGCQPSAETFVNGGQYNPLHRTPSKEYADWMAFIHDFFMEITRPFVEMIHARGKKAFFLLGDQWVGSEPLAGRFDELGMDGVVKAVFNGFETRIAGAMERIPIREIRFHPYFFPKEVTGKPTFSAGGAPTEDLKLYWANIRRACLRVRIDRIGFGGCVSNLEKYPDFVDYVAAVSRQARTIRILHQAGDPWTAPVHVAVLNAWGRKRAWMCCGHMAHNNTYNQVLESLSGLPVHVEFLSFQDLLERGIPAHVNVIVNAGRAGTSWSGGEVWRDPALIEAITAFVARGGGLVGIGEPAACAHGNRWLQLAHILGVDREPLLCERDIDYAGRLENGHFLTRDMHEPLDFVSSIPNLEMLSAEVRIVAWRKTGDTPYFHTYLQPQVVVNRFRAGRGVYLAGFKYNAANTRLLHRALCWAAAQDPAFDTWRCDDPEAECAYFPGAQCLAIVNNSQVARKVKVLMLGGDTLTVDMDPLAFYSRAIAH